MKLRTEMLRGPDGMTITAGYSEGKYSAREHDAAAAHALMMAMGEFSHSKVLDFVKIRASELLREWGFDTEEDA